MTLHLNVLINRLVDHVPCGRTIGHGESCVKGHECDSCRVRCSVADDLEKLAHLLRGLDNSLSFYKQAVADPKGFEVGAVRDGIEWLLESAEKVVKNA